MSTTRPEGSTPIKADPFSNNFYERLGIKDSASYADIRRAYKKEAAKNHPDRYSEDTKERAEIAFKNIGEAFSTLSDPTTKYYYNKKLYKKDSNIQKKRKKRAVPSASGYYFNPALSQELANSLRYQKSASSFFTSESKKNA